MEVFCVKVCLIYFQTFVCVFIDIVFLGTYSATKALSSGKFMLGATDKMWPLPNAFIHTTRTMFACALYCQVGDLHFIETCKILLFVYRRTVNV
jgi:hypothetical protein